MAVVSAIGTKPAAQSSNHEPKALESARPTRVECFCDGILEAGWLAALVLAPLLFDVRAQRIFENALTIRCIALVMAAAGLGKLGCRVRGPHAARVPFRAVPVAVIAFTAATLLSTALSVNPGLSWWGSYDREQGTLTLLSYLVVFAGIATSLRREEQVRRFIDTVALVSLPISLYGMLQRLHSDPLIWNVDASGRVMSTLVERS